MAVFLRPGRQLKTFRIFRQNTALDGKRRPSNATDPAEIGKFKATIADASQQEIERWDRINHPITHTLSQTGTSPAVAGDTLTLDGAPGRKFYVQGKTDAGELGFCTVYYVQERKGSG